MIKAQRHLFNSSWQFFCYGIIFICFCFSILHFFRADIYYDTDIARDFLLLQDMIDQGKPTLIGARSSIAGIFHGPLYYWVVFPFFFLGHGNPLSLAAFWLLAYLLFIITFCICVCRLTSRRTALLAITLLITITCFYPLGYTHTTLATFLLMPTFYFTYQYMQHTKIKDLIISVLLCGLLIQFQMAVGIPVTFLLGCLCLYHLLKTQHYLHAFSIILLIIPLSTFLLFDLRHDFIQSCTAIRYLFPSEDETIITQNHTPQQFWTTRFTSFLDSFALTLLDITTYRYFISYIVFSTIVLVTCYHYHHFTASHRLSFNLFSYIFLGFWFITLVFRDPIWPHYYRTFSPLIIFTFCWLLAYAPPFISRFLISFLLILNLSYNCYTAYDYWHDTNISDEIHWKFYRQLARDLEADAAGKPFGYFIFTPDQYGYQAKYALRYFAGHNDYPMSAYQRLPLTYLLIAPDVSGNPWSDASYWRRQQIRLTRDPDKTWDYSQQNPSYTVFRYDLTTSEATVSADPNLIDGIQFR